MTEIEREEYDELAKQTASDPGACAAQKRLAEFMTRLVHGDEGLASANRASEILFGGEIDQLNDKQLVEIFADVPSCEASRASLTGEGWWIVEALREAGLSASSGEARRAIGDGGVYVNNRRVTDVNRKLTLDDLASETVMVLRKGKRNYALVRFNE